MNLIDSIEAIVRATESRQHLVYPAMSSQPPAPSDAGQQAAKEDSPQSRPNGLDRSA